MEAHDDQVVENIICSGHVDGMSSGSLRSIMTSAGKDHDDEDDHVSLPGFRFHPTDEELVGFYLRRKIEKRPLSIELIKHVDIYKFDPWDLPKASSINVDKEWYFFCKRGRKYRNSIRPNRVTGSGFWKATGIDKPVYSSEGGGGHDCIGLKKSLVYYRGASGKGTKTDWMMHEFRLPPSTDKSIENMDAKSAAREAEVWTLCRILKRNPSYRKLTPDWRQVAADKSKNLLADASSKTCSVESSGKNRYMNSFSTEAAAAALLYQQEIEKKPYDPPFKFEGHLANRHNFQQGHFSPSIASSIISLQRAGGGGGITEILRQADWEDLQSVVDGAAAPPASFSMHY